MKLTNNQIFFLTEMIYKLKQDTEMKFSAKTSFILAYNFKQLSNLYNTIVETRIEIFKRYGNVDPQGAATIPAENVAAVNQEINEFSNIETEIDLKTLTIDDLSDVTLTIADMENLMPIIENIG